MTTQEQSEIKVKTACEPFIMRVWGNATDHDAVNRERKKLQGAIQKLLDDELSTARREAEELRAQLADFKIKRDLLFEKHDELRQQLVTMTKERDEKKRQRELALDWYESVAMVDREGGGRHHCPWCYTSADDKKYADVQHTPDCPIGAVSYSTLPSTVLAEHDAALVKPLVEALEQMVKSPYIKTNRYGQKNDVGILKDMALAALARYRKEAV